ncbi:2OG-Fe(II) oxygenase [Microbulbifer sp. VTAC004]|uniref:2OG-Fe(II) oxygenase n=1 Tax=Microbulbifer sp. VTAC004 TaxID=3243386 RepID=UPI0040396600
MEIERTTDPRIIYVHDVFKKTECEQIIQLAESVKFNTPGRVVMGNCVGNVVVPSSRRCHEIWLSQHSELTDLEKKLEVLYQDIAELYRKNVANVEAYLVAEPARIVRYRPTGFFRLHSDLRHCRPGEWRQLTMVINLNHTYGGQLFFPQQNVCCNTNPGSAVVFPVSDNYLHEAFPPENDNKYILLNWLSACEDILADKAELIGIKKGESHAAA